MAGWEATRDTLQLWTQVVGKIRLANTPLVNHWWNVPLYVTARGLGTGLIPHGDRSFQIDFDFLDHRLDITRDRRCRRARCALEPMSVARFHREVMARLDELGLSTPIWTTPVEIPGAIPFELDEQHAAYDADAVQRFWLALVQMERVFEVFRARFVGKVSPVHLFWGALDLAVTRFSGRVGPAASGRRAELRSAGDVGGLLARGEQRRLLAGARRRGRLLLVRLPRAGGLPDDAGRARRGAVRRGAGRVHAPVHRRAHRAGPDAVLLEFLQSTYEAAAAQPRTGTGPASSANWMVGPVDRCSRSP